MNAVDQADQMVRRLLERWDVVDIRAIKIGKLAPAPVSTEPVPPPPAPIDRSRSFDRPEKSERAERAEKNAAKKPPPSPFFAEVRWIKHSIDEQAYEALRERGAPEA